MKLTINGEARELDVAKVSDLCVSLSLPDRGVAVAVNGRMVPRTEWCSVALGEGDAVTIVRAAKGG